MVILEIAGEPVPRAERISGRFLYDKRAKEKKFIKWQLKSQFRSELLKGALRVSFLFYLAIPASTTKARKRAMLEGRLRPTTKPDLSNLIKLYEDCLTGIVIEDDRFIVDESQSKYYDLIPRTIIKINEVLDGESGL